MAVSEMAIKFYFQNIDIKNFRTFKHLTIDKFKRINIIGGLNGSGKTALLESLFLYLDRRNPLCLVKPMQFRRIEFGGPVDPQDFLYDPGTTEAYITYRHRVGIHTLKATYERLPDHVSVSIQQSNLQGGNGSNLSNTNGMSLKTIDSDGREIEETFLAPVVVGATGTIVKVSDLAIPNGTFISTYMRASPQEVSTRLSAIIRQRRLDTLLKALRLLTPQLKSLMTLQDGAVPQVVADIDGHMMPVQMLGDGFQNLFQTLLSIMNARDGVVLLDEIDAAMHYSKISTVWSIIAKMADEENCQIFATTHSRECINSAAEGIRNAGYSSDFQYLRLERGTAGHQAIRYDMEEVHEAEVSNIEIR